MTPMVPWPFLQERTEQNGISILCGPSPFEAGYHKVRALEQRILSDDQVSQLPQGTGLWNAHEWRIRARSADRLARALEKRGQGQRILEVGCGNGWLSALLQHRGHHVMGIDVFTAELEQAARVFPSGPVFARADLFRSPLPSGGFEAIVLAASIQYFRDPVATLERTLELLAPGGEVHVLDTIIYPDEAAAGKARLRSDAYYKSLDVPEMVGHYYAHTLATFARLGSMKVLSAPRSVDKWLSRLGGNCSPFSHLVLSR